MPLSKELEMRLNHLLQQEYLSQQESEELNDLSRQKSLLEEAEALELGFGFLANELDEGAQTAVDESVVFDGLQDLLKEEYGTPALSQRVLDGEDVELKAEQEVEALNLTLSLSQGWGLDQEAVDHEPEKSDVGDGHPKKSDAVGDDSEKLDDKDSDKEELEKNPLLVELIAAAGKGDLAAVTRLVPMIPEAEIARKNEPLIQAAANGHLEVVQYFLSRKIFRENVLAQDNKAVRLATKNGHSEVVYCLLEVEGVVDQVIEEIDGDDGDFCTFLIAANHGRAEIVRRLLEIPEIYEQASDSENQAIQEAGQKGHLEVVKCLLEVNCVVEQLIDYTSPENGNAIFSNITEGGYVDVMKYILEKVPVIRENIAGQENQALTCAAENGHFEAVMYLLTMPDVREALAIENNKVLASALHEGHVAIVEYLINFEVEWNLGLMSELLTDDESLAEMIKEGRIYFEKQGDKLKYVIYSYTAERAVQEKFRGELDISVEGDLTEECLNSHKSKILEITSKRGHAPKRYPVREELAADKDFLLLRKCLPKEIPLSSLPESIQKVILKTEEAQRQTEKRSAAYVLIETYKKMGIKLPDWVLERYNPIKEKVDEIHDVLEELLPREIGNLILEKAELPKNDNTIELPKARLARTQNLLVSVDQVIEEQAKLKAALEKSLDGLVSAGALEEDGLVCLRDRRIFEREFSESRDKLLSVRESMQAGIRRFQDSIERAENAQDSQEDEMSDAAVPVSSEKPQLTEDSQEVVEADKVPFPSLQELATDYLIDEFLRFNERELLTKLHGKILADQAKRGFAILEALFKQSIMAIEQAQGVLKIAEPAEPIQPAKDKPLDKETEESFELINRSLMDLLQARVVFRKMKQAIGIPFSNASSILKNLEALLQLATESAAVIQERTQNITKRLGTDKALSVSSQTPVEGEEPSQGLKEAVIEVEGVFKQAHQLVEQTEVLFGIYGKQDKFRESVTSYLCQILGAKASLQALKARPEAQASIQEVVQSARASLNEIQAKLKVVEEVTRAAEEAAKAAEKASRSGSEKKPKEDERKIALEDQRGHSKIFSVLGKGSMPVERNLAGQAYYEPDVPGDGTCLFYSVVFAYLLPVVNDPVLFKARFIKLFGEEVAGSVEDNRKLFLRYDGNSRFIQKHAAALEVLVNVNFRTRLVDFMRKNQAELSGFVTEAEDFKVRLEKMGDPKRRGWGDQPEIEAISRFLGVRVTVCQERGKEIVPMGNLGDHGRDYAERLYLVHTAAGKAKSKASIGGNHYHYLVEKQYLPLAGLKEVKETKEIKEAKDMKEVQEVVAGAKALDAVSADASLADRLKALKLSTVLVAVDRGESCLTSSSSSSCSSLSSFSPSSFSAKEPARDQVDRGQPSVGLALESSITVGAQFRNSQPEQPAAVASQAKHKRKRGDEQASSLPSSVVSLSHLGFSDKEEQQQQQQQSDVHQNDVHSQGDPGNEGHQPKLRRLHLPTSQADPSSAILPTFGSLASGPGAGSSEAVEQLTGERGKLKRKSRR